MRSSESTHIPSGSGVPTLWLLVVGDDHPRACTGRRLLQHGLARAAPAQRALPPHPIVLDPFAPNPLSGRDRATAFRGGILGVDCSWNILGERGAYLAAPSLGPKRAGHRRLPFLMATNPQHFGRIGELNTAEALAAALFVLGFEPAARNLLEGFAGGRSFFDVNRARLDAYRGRPDPTEMRAAERAIFSS
ncbi:MAG: DUF367 domain-containing protein [Thermoplasmata archaeon]|nr:DUF367 domain-containing protein [Thermoplasmata archaeon]